MYVPLAERMRPQVIDDMVGQKHILAKGKPLRRMIEQAKIPNLVFYGPPGTGKTTLARIISKSTNRKLHKLNATTASISDIRMITSELGTLQATNGILLYLDEIQYFNKKQQQTLLEFLETGDITLIASTTENPYFCIYNALLSRSIVFEFEKINAEEMQKAIDRSIRFLEKEWKAKIHFDKIAIKSIAEFCAGDVRKAVNTVELCAMAADKEKQSYTVSYETVCGVLQQAVIPYDKRGDEHYDLLSAFQKSMRGSDCNAAIYYLARLIESGDLISISRRLLVCACEDVGLAYPQVIPIVKSCVDIAFQVGLPEARIPLSDAVILVCNAPKSNSAYLAIDQAIAEVKSGRLDAIPRHLQNMHFDGEDCKQKGQFYQYPHEFPNHWVQQQYLPDQLKDQVYYTPGQNKTEQSFQAYWNTIKY